jgi:hypothetical protein
MVRRHDTISFSLSGFLLLLARSHAEPSEIFHSAWQSLQRPRNGCSCRSPSLSPSHRSTSRSLNYSAAILIAIKKGKFCFHDHVGDVHMNNLRHDSMSNSQISAKIDVNMGESQSRYFQEEKEAEKLHQAALAMTSVDFEAPISLFPVLDLLWERFLWGLVIYDGE